MNNQINNQKIWTKDFIVLLASNFFVAITFYLLMTSMAVYAIDQFKVSESSAGFAASIFVIGALFARVFAGKYIDIVGRKKLLYIGLGLFFLSTVFYLFIDLLPLLYLLRFIHGAAFGAASTVLITVAMSGLPENKKGEGTGYISLSTAAATAIGPFLALFLTSHFSYQTMFMFCAAFSLFSFIAGILANVRNYEAGEQAGTPREKGFRLTDYFEKKVLPLSLLMFACGVAYSSILSFINSFAIEMKLTEAASFFFVVYAFFLFISRPLTGKLLDQKGANVVVYPAFVLFSFSFICIGTASNGFTLLTASALLAFGYGTLMPSIQTVVAKVSPPHRLGLAISTLFICMDAGLGAGAYIIGLLVQQFGYQTMYLILAAFVFCLVPAYYFVHGKRAASVSSEL